MLNLIAAYLYAPMGNPGIALAKLKELDRWCSLSKGRSRLTSRNRLYAEAYLATRDFPMAMAHLEAALETASGMEIDRLVDIHTRLRNTSYWNHSDIGRITVKINQIKYPELFR
jgi:hypothetical protein